MVGPILLINEITNADFFIDIRKNILDESKTSNDVQDAVIPLSSQNLSIVHNFKFLQKAKRPNDVPVKHVYPKLVSFLHANKPSSSKTIPASPQTLVF